VILNQTAARLQKRQRTFEEKQVEIETTLSRDVAFRYFSRSSANPPYVAINGFVIDERLNTENATSRLKVVSISTCFSSNVRCLF